MRFIGDEEVKAPKLQLEKLLNRSSENLALSSLDSPYLQVLQQTMTSKAAASHVHKFCSTLGTIVTLQSSLSLWFRSAFEA
jgi:hypothetical protein